MRPAVLMYHRVATERLDPWGLAVTAGRFDHQVQWLQQHRAVLPLPEFARLHRQSRLPAGAVAITFDDGYACNATAAAPILERLGAPATFFLTTGPLAAGLEFWWDDLQRIVFDAQVERLDLTVESRLSVQLGDPLGGSASWAPLAPAGNRRQRAFLELWHVLRSLEPPAQAAALAELRAQTATPVQPRESHRPMTMAEVQRLSRSPAFDLGCHTLTHPALPERSREVQRAEITHSRFACAEMIGRMPTTFAYPFGDYDATTVNLVREAGYEAACTTDSIGVTRGQDVLTLPRMQVGDWSSEQLERQLRVF
jgi:peptidoglycan/xylan/chitin deacetylase (PgdA/CDA1 family)